MENRCPLSWKIHIDYVCCSCIICTNFTWWILQVPTASYLRIVRSTKVFLIWSSLLKFLLNGKLSQMWLTCGTTHSSLLCRHTCPLSFPHIHHTCVVHNNRQHSIVALVQQGHDCWCGIATDYLHTKHAKNFFNLFCSSKEVLSWRFSNFTTLMLARIKIKKKNVTRYATYKLALFEILLY